MLATPVLVRAKVSEVLRRNAEAQVIALAATPVWPHDERLDVSTGRAMVVRPCVSTLAIRDELARVADLAPGDVLVLLTDQETSELGASITARFVGQKVLPLDRWQQLASLFRARDIDPALVEEQWAVDALLAVPPVDGYPAVPSGYLDRASALSVLAETRVGLSRLDLDLTGLLQWSIDPAHLVRWCALDPAIRDGLTAWLAGRGGHADVARAVLRCFAGGYGPDTVAVGLVLAALTHSDVCEAAQVPRTMLETRAVGGALDAATATEWGRAAEGLVQRLLTQDGRVVAGTVLRRAEELLTEQGAGDLAYPSTVLESGLTQRVRSVGSQVTALLRKRRLYTDDLAPAEGESARLKAHALAVDHGERVRRVEMAIRLLRWLAYRQASGQPPAASLAEAARRQQCEDAWVDVARARVWEGDVDPAVAAAYRALCAAVDAVRAEHEQRFARLLADHVRTGSTLRELLPVEDVLGEVVLPLSGELRVLLLVLDGLSTGVARELLADLSSRGWVEHTLAPARPVLAALPSVTRVSRTSLLCGRLTDGTRTHERAAFDERGWPLFHKSDLTTAGAGDALAPKVADAIRSGTAVVGVVVNTVDDALDKGGRTPWTADSVDRLLDLLTVAHESDRVVLLASDHGHVHERGSRLSSDDSGGARWRSSAQPPGEDEVELTGPRVLLGNSRIVAAWNERLRYTDIRNGYHGGASAQEVVIPLALLGRAELGLPGWTPVHHAAPAWWVEAASAPAAARTPKPSPRRGKPAARAVPAEPSAPALFDASEVVVDTWVERVLDTDVMVARLARMRRGTMPADRLVALLRTLDQRGGAATRAAVARALDVPEARVGSHIAAAQRVLNIDGYEVLRIDGDTVRLNAALLKTQAGLA
ncbi:bacteriophage resistance gene PglZ [Candidatus Protofrankia californiensis]|uniref:Bacteriophage resistance gene PglZ n=1 Tax=Candidatus Protofrankia californiensis TaxID=1839754 RepID=A0A1C3NZ52_9ACTN|nr:bacteriophage resistance gene PglZ [Candidatus Protofrankia californiensis]